MIGGIRMGNIMVDCDDEQKLCEFYHQLLGWEKQNLYGCPAVCGPGGIILLFAQDEDYIPPVWPEQGEMQQKQMHFDFGVPDVAAAVAYAQSIGAAVAASQFGSGEYVTMLDPAGHPFCLCSQENEP